MSTNKSKNNLLGILIALILCMPMAAKGIELKWFIAIVILAGASFAFLMNRKGLLSKLHYYLGIGVLLLVNIIFIFVPRTETSNAGEEIDISGVWLSDDESLELKIINNDDVFVKYKAEEVVEYSLMEENKILTIEGYLDEDKFRFKILDIDLQKMKIRDEKSGQVFVLYR